MSGVGRACSRNPLRGRAHWSRATALPACPVDGPPNCAPDRAAGKYYLFSLVASGAALGYRQPDEVGRSGFYDALTQAYGAAFPVGRPCRAGPLFGMVARELHQASPCRYRRDPHLHAACACPGHHRWKALEQYMRQQLRIKAPRLPGASFSLIGSNRLLIGALIGAPQVLQFP